MDLMLTVDVLYSVLAVLISMVPGFFLYLYRNKIKTAKTFFLLPFLRFLSFFLLLLLLINPRIKQKITETEKPNLVVAVDNSISIGHLGREASVKKAIKQLKSSPELTAKFNVEYYTFGADVHPTDSLNFSDAQTDISNALKTLKKIYKDQTAPIILVSDGNQTRGSDYEYVFTDNKQQLFPVIVGDTVAHSDLRIQRLNLNKYTYLNNKFPLEVFLFYEGKKTVKTKFFVKKGKKTVYSTPVTFSAKENSKIVQLHLTSSKAGTQKYRMELQAIADEKNTHNNIRDFAIEVLKQGSDIVLLTDMVHPDLGALKRSIESSKHRKVTVKKVTSFNAPLKKYALAILYQPNRKFKAVFDMLKKENINSMMITGEHTDWFFLNSVQNNFFKKTGTRIEKYIPSLNVNYSSFVADDAIDFKDLPPLTAFSGAVTFNVPFQTLLYQKQNAALAEQPLLATFEKGKNKHALLTGEGIWKWRLIYTSQKKSSADFDIFIGKMMQYLASKSHNPRLDIDYEPFYYSGDKITFKAYYFDKNYNFDPRAVLWLNLRDESSKKSKKYRFSPRENSYTLHLDKLPEANYSFKLNVANREVQTKGSFKILPFEIERQFLSPNVRKMKNISEATGGQVVYIDHMGTLVKKLEKDKRYTNLSRIREKTVYLIDWKWLLVLLVITLSTEWFIRKYRGMI